MPKKKAKKGGSWQVFVQSHGTGRKRLTRRQTKAKRKPGTVTNKDLAAIRKKVDDTLAGKKPKTVNVYAIDRLQATANEVWTYWCIRFNASNPNRSKEMAVKYNEAVAKLARLADALVDPHCMINVPVVM